MSKVYDPILCMMVEKSTHDADSLIGKKVKIKGKIGTVKSSPNNGYYWVEYENGMKENFSAMELKSWIKGMNDKRTVDSTRGREVGKYINEIFQEMGINNSIEKYDKVLFGVKQILGESLLQGEDLKKAVRRETERLLKKYGGKDSAVDRAISTIDKSAMTVKVIGTNWETGKKVEFYEDVRTSSLPAAQQIIERRYKDLHVMSVTKAYDSSTVDADTGLRVGKVGNHYGVFYNGSVMIHCDTWQEAEEEMVALKKQIEKDKKK